MPKKDYKKNNKLDSSFDVLMSELTQRADDFLKGDEKLKKKWKESTKVFEYAKRIRDIANELQL